MGFLDSGYLDTEHSVAETRILFEIKTCKTCIQSDITKTLHMDKSYLSRIIKRFYKNGLIEKVKSAEDKRATYIALTKKGDIAFELNKECASSCECASPGGFLRYRERSFLYLKKEPEAAAK